MLTVVALDRDKVAYTIRQAADATGLSDSTIRRGLHSTDPRSFPPPLRGKRAGGKGKILIPRAELDRWIESLPDA